MQQRLDAHGLHRLEGGEVVVGADPGQGLGADAEPHPAAGMGGVARRAAIPALLLTLVISMFSGGTRKKTTKKASAMEAPISVLRRSRRTLPAFWSCSPVAVAAGARLAPLVSRPFLGAPVHAAQDEHR